LTCLLPTFYPSVNSLECVPEATDCLTHDVNRAICLQCNPGFYWNVDVCVTCDNIDLDCTQCTHEGLCTECVNIPDEIPQVDGFTCIDKALNCDVLLPTDF